MLTVTMATIMIVQSHIRIVHVTEKTLNGRAIGEHELCLTYLF